MSRYSHGMIEPTYDNANDLFDNTLSLQSLGNIVGKWNVVYGFDHATGYFLQLFPLDEKAEEWLPESDDECFDIDSMFGGLTGIELAYFLRMFSGNAEHIDLASLDLPF
jgi:hypothetical protein